MKGRWGLGVGGVLLAVPLVIAVVGPWFVGEVERGRAFVDRGVLGTDFVGRDVLELVLGGGRSVVGIALVATGVSYAVGVPLALVAAMARRRWLDEVVMRPLDVVLAVPSLLVLILVAGIAPRGYGTVVVVVAVVTVPDLVRVVRAAALEVASRPALEAMRLQGETRRRLAFGYVVPAVAPTLVADLGVRITTSLYLVASAGFLGVGVAPDAADWAVMVDRNQAGLFLIPSAVVVPALLIIAWSVGVNLVFDRAVRR